VGGFRPGVALDQNLAVCGHAWRGESEGFLQLQLDADDLLDAVVAEVGVFRGECSLRIDARDVGVNRLLWVRVEIDACGLPDFYFADVAFGYESAQINLVEIEQCDDRGACVDDLAWLCGAGDDGSGEGRTDNKALTVGFGFRKLSTGLLGLRGGAGNLGLLLRDLAADDGYLRLADVRVGERCLRGRDCCLRCFDATLRCGDPARLRTAASCKRVGPGRLSRWPSRRCSNGVDESRR